MSSFNMPRWTEAEDVLLRKYWYDGLNSREIAERFGNRSESAVHSRATKLGLMRKETGKEWRKFRTGDVDKAKARDAVSEADDAKKDAEVERRLRILSAGYGKTVSEVVAETGYPADEVERELKYLARHKFFLVRDGRYYPPHAYERGRKAS